MRIGLDIDQTVVDFMNPYIQLFGEPKNDYEITRNVFKLKYNRKFWVNLPILNVPDFKPELFCTKRINPKEYTKESLRRFMDVQGIPFYQIYYQKGSKSKRIKGRVDVFIDDSVSNFKELNEHGVPCLLIDCPWNQEYETPLRIFSLKYREIEYVYNKNFKK